MGCRTTPLSWSVSLNPSRPRSAGTSRDRAWSTGTRSENTRPMPARTPMHSELRTHLCTTNPDSHSCTAHMHTRAHTNALKPSFIIHLSKLSPVCFLSFHNSWIKCKKNSQNQMSKSIVKALTNKYYQVLWAFCDINKTGVPLNLILVSALNTYAFKHNH